MYVGDETRLSLEKVHAILKRTCNEVPGTTEGLKFGVNLGIILIEAAFPEVFPEPGKGEDKPQEMAGE